MIFGFTYQQIAIAVAVVVISTLASTAIVVAYLVSIAPDHFVATTRGASRRMRSRGARIAWAVGKNLLGLVLIVVGIVLMLPGVPGQGLLTVLVGLLMLDIPGKQRFERSIMRREAIRRTVDKLRARFDKPALVIDVEVIDGEDAQSVP